MPELLPHVFVTGANGQLGRLVLKTLARHGDLVRVTGGVRRADAAADLASTGVDVRIADYSRPQTLDAAFAGIDRLLLISSNEIGQRIGQHRTVIEAAKRAGVGLLAYTSVLHADASPLGLAEDHRQTEAAIRASGIPFVLLRNGWYTENYAASIPSALAHGAFLGSAGSGRVSSASRLDYAEAAARILVATDDQAGRIYELAGDEAYTLQEFATEISRQAGRPAVYKDLPAAEFKAILVGAGLPDGLASLLADSDVGASKGALFDEGHHLGKLIGRPTTPWAETIKAALKG